MRSRVPLLMVLSHSAAATWAPGILTAAVNGSSIVTLQSTWFISRYYLKILNEWDVSGEFQETSNIIAQVHIQYN